jgi:magnesium transporter
MSSGNSPPSEKCQTRYSTPAPELDDHRFQPSSLPRADTVGAMPRRNTMRAGSIDRPNLLQVNDALRDAGHGPISRDFENAITDDECNASRSINEIEVPMVRRDSISPAIRRTTVRRSRNNQDRPSRSRESSPSSRSSSPPNSVEAFADPRRRERANTIGSRAPSDLELHRTISAVGSHHQRRPTFSQGSVIKLETQDSRRDCAEDDVCFPPYEEPSKTYTIDFEELEEFVALNNRRRPDVGGPCRRKHSISCQAKPKLEAYRQSGQSSTARIPEIRTQDASPYRSYEKGAVDEPITMDEKLEILESGSDRRSEDLMFYRYRFFSSELQSTIHAAEMGDLLAEGDTFRDLFELSPDGGAWWLDVMNPSDDEVHAICSAFSIHPLTSEDIRTQEAREKVELFKQYYFVCFRTFDSLNKQSEDYMEPVHIYIVVFRQGVLSFSFQNTPHAANVRKRIGKLRDYLSLSSDWICYAMM